MKVLVTGGAGYIGSTTANLLIENQHEVTIFDNLSTGFKILVPPQANFFQGNLLDIQDLKSVFSQTSFDAVIHFAASASVGESMQFPDRYYRNNVVGTLNLLDTMTQFHCPKIIFSSTCAIFGIPKEIPIHEQTPKNPINPYGYTKWVMEQAMQHYHQAYSIDYIAFRYFNAAGGTLHRGEMHEPETHLIPNIFKSIESKLPLKLFGNNYPTSDGTCIRDYIHILDLAQAHMDGLSLSGSHQLNLGSGVGYSNLEIIQNIEKITGHSVKYEIADRRPGDPPKLVASNTKIKEILNWEPKHSSLSEIIHSAWEWHQKKPLPNE